jgi:hypothetical protein
MSLDSPSSQPHDGEVGSGGLGAVKRWPTRKKQVNTRYLVLACSYLAFGFAVGIMMWHRGYTTTTSVGGTTGTTSTLQSNQSIYQTNPGPVTVILSLMAGALLVSTVSLIRRVARQSPKVDVPGLVAASVIGVVGVLGLLSVGPFILPLAVLLLILAIPMDSFAP